MKTNIPEFLLHLPTYNGYPVPFMVFWNGVTPDFRVTDMAKWTEVVGKRLCAICGKPLGYFCWFIGGPACREHRLFFDPPMHEACADFSAKSCPFLNGKREEYRPLESGPLPGVQIRVVEVMSKERPKQMFLLRARTQGYRGVRNGEDHLVQVVQPWLEEKSF